MKRNACSGALCYVVACIHRNLALNQIVLLRTTCHVKVVMQDTISIRHTTCRMGLGGDGPHPSVRQASDDPSRAGWPLARQQAAPLPPSGTPRNTGNYLPDTRGLEVSPMHLSDLTM